MSMKEKVLQEWRGVFISRLWENWMSLIQNMVEKSRMESRLTGRILDFVKMSSLYDNLSEIFWTILYNCKENSSNVTKLSYSFLGNSWLHKSEKELALTLMFRVLRKMDISEQFFLKVFNILKFSSCCIDLINRSCRRLDCNRLNSDLGSFPT